MKRSTTALATLLTASVLFLGCGPSSNKDGVTSSDTPTMMLHCGAGIRPPADELVAVFGEKHGVQIECNYGGSEILMTTIREHEEGDLYMPGDISYVDRAEEQGIVVDREQVCYFVPVILVKAGNPKNIQGLRDFLRDDVQLALGNPEACAIGRKTKKIFEKNGLDQKTIAENRRMESLTVNELGIAVGESNLDAAIVWDAVAESFEDKCDIVPIPQDENIISTIPIASLVFAEQPELAKKFVEFAASDEGRAIFEKHHYTTSLEE